MDRAQRTALCSKGPEEIHSARELWEAARRKWVADEKAAEEGREEIQHTRNQAEDQEESVQDARRALDKVREKGGFIVGPRILRACLCRLSFCSGVPL